MGQPLDCFLVLQKDEVVAYEVPRLDGLRPDSFEKQLLFVAPNLHQVGATIRLGESCVVHSDLDGAVWVSLVVDAG